MNSYHLASYYTIICLLRTKVSRIVVMLRTKEWWVMISKMYGKSIKYIGDSIQAYSLETYIAIGAMRLDIF